MLYYARASSERRSFTRSKWGWVKVAVYRFSQASLILRHCLFKHVSYCMWQMFGGRNGLLQTWRCS